MAGVSGREWIGVGGMGGGMMEGWHGEVEDSGVEVVEEVEGMGGRSWKGG